MKNLPVMLLLLCIGASVSAMQRSEQDLKKMVNVYIQEYFLNREYTIDDEDKEIDLLAISLLLLQRGNNERFESVSQIHNPIAPIVCQNQGCGRVFGARGNFLHHSRYCRFAVLEQKIKYNAYRCTSCNFGTRSAREFEKHSSKCQRFKKKLELLALRQSASTASIAGSL